MQTGDRAKPKFGTVTALLLWVVWALMVVGVSYWLVGDLPVIVLLFNVFVILLVPNIYWAMKKPRRRSRRGTPLTGEFGASDISMVAPFDGGCGDGGGGGGDGG